MVRNIRFTARVVRSIIQAEMDRSSEALSESALDAARAEKSDTPQTHSEDVEALLL